MNPSFTADFDLNRDQSEKEDTNLPELHDSEAHLIRIGGQRIPDDTLKVHVQKSDGSHKVILHDDCRRSTLIGVSKQRSMNQSGSQ